MNPRHKNKKFIKYTEKQHDRYEKFNEKREKNLEKQADKAIEDFWKNRDEESFGKAIDTLTKEYENKAIADLQHKRIDELTIDNYKFEKKLGKAVKRDKRANIAREAVEAIDRGAEGKYGNAGDLAKYNSRMSKEEYRKIHTDATEKATRDMYEKYYNPPRDSYKYQDLTPREKRKMINKAIRSVARSAMKL